MQVQIAHKQEKSGFFILLKLLFSEDEQKLIAARKLHDMIIMSGQAEAPASNTRVAVTIILAKIGLWISPFLLLGSCAVAMAHGKAGDAMFALVIGLIVLCFVLSRQVQTKGEVKTYTVNHFLIQPIIRLYAPNLVDAKIIDQDIRKNLTNLKAYFEESKRIPDADTFEL